MTAYAVIGAFYGDEGKGLTTDYLAHKLGGKQVVVVRSNGGAQAAHTVQTPLGARHVFHHFCSGSFVGARTHLSRFMIINPIAFNEEWDQLEKLGVHPVVTVDPGAMVTTPFDMLINQAIETMRSEGRHGSCGLGINETVTRHEYADDDFKLSAENLVFPGKVLEKLDHIREEWVDSRWRALTERHYGEEYPMIGDFAQLIESADVVDRYLDACALMLSRIKFLNDAEVMNHRTKEGLPTEHIIFEGAQGLLLDENFGEMPYCTRSNTGLRNVMYLLSLTRIRELNVHYVMRAYTTRHGAGPLLAECPPEMIGVKFSDPTNVHNEWQKSIRVAPLHIENLSGIRKDQLSIQPYIDEFDFRLNYTVVMTCMDQVGNPETVGLYKRVEGYARFLGLVGNIAKAVGEVKSLDFLTSWGPTRQTMQREVVEYFETSSPDGAAKLAKLCELNEIDYLTVRNDILCRFRTEEERQLIRLASPKELTKRVAAL